MLTRRPLLDQHTHKLTKNTRKLKHCPSFATELVIYAVTKTFSNKYAVRTRSVALVSSLVAFIWFCGCGYS